MERQFLQLGNSKLGSCIHNWSLPAGLTCPGATDVCQSNCYAKRGRYHFAKVQEALQWNYEQSLRDDFVNRMTREIQEQGVLVLRIHVSGDFYSKAYAEKWLTIIKRFPRMRAYFYTRSWRVPEIVPTLRKMAGLSTCRAWFSVDKDASIKAPKNVRLAYLQVDDELPADSELILRVRRLRKTLAELPQICPAETPQGKGQNCAGCQRCFR